MHARQRILTNGSFKDGIEIEMKWVVTRSNSYLPLRWSGKERVKNCVTLFIGDP